MVSIPADITERKRAEESLKVFRNLIDRSTDAIEVLEPGTLRFLDCNTAAHQTLGYTREEFLNLSAHDIDPLMDQAFATHLVDELDKAGHVIFESIHRRKDGSSFPVEINAKTVHLEKDYRLAVVRDITERKQAEERLLEYEKVVEGLEEMITVVDRGYRYLLANQAFLKHRGMQREQLLGCLVSDVLGHEVFETIVKPRLDECFSGKVVRYERTFSYPDLGERLLSVSYFPIEGPDGVDRAACVLHDITERRRAEARSTAFAALARKLSGAVTQLDAARIIAETASELFGWDSCNLDLYDADLDIVHPMLNIDTIAGRRVDITSAYVDRKPSARSQLVIDQGPQLTLREDPIEFDEDAIPFGDTLKPSASLMTVPVHHAARVVGLLSIQSYTPRAYDAAALGHLQSLADHCGAALDRIHAQEALRKSEERFRELFENAKDAYYVHDLNGKYISVNRAAERLCGYPREEIIGRSFIDFIAADQLELVSENLGRKLIAEGETAYETELIAGDGGRLPIEVNSHLIYENGVAIGVQGIARDITARKQAEDALQRYPRQLIEAQEAERQRIARELHDQIGQVLTAVHLNLKAIWETCESASSRALIDEGVAIVDEAIGQVRDLSFELRPSLLDDLGLAAALRWYADRFAQRTGIRVTTSIGLPELPKRLRRELETACFRIVQEALTNVARHAQAGAVVLEVKRQNDEVRLFVIDDGHGFDVRDQNLAPFTTQVGLRGMRERALALNGRLEIESSPSHGTKICAHFPESTHDRAKAAVQNTGTTG
jgi:PAS domain S-box-containing protein